MTGGRWRRIVLGDVLVEHVVELRGRARVWPCAVEVAGVLAAAAPLGMPSGKIGHHPGWKPLQGSAAIMSQAGLQARAGSPDPLRRRGLWGLGFGVGPFHAITGLRVNMKLCFKHHQKLRPEPS